MALNATLPVLVIVFAVVYAGVPSAETKTVGVAPMNVREVRSRTRTRTAACWLGRGRR